MDYKVSETTFQTKKQEKQHIQYVSYTRQYAFGNKHTLTKRDVTEDCNGMNMKISLNPASFSTVTSTNVRTSHQNFLTFSFTPFATLV